jgi:Na+-driven multidrug efflux pump
MAKPGDNLGVRALLQQMLSHGLIFAAQNAGGFAERALLAADTAATAALGLSWTAFCLLHAFTANVVNVCPLVVGRCAGRGDDLGARAAAGQALLLAGCGGAVGLALAVAAGVAAACSSGPGCGAAFFLAAQGLALGPLLAASVLTGYCTGTTRIRPQHLAAVTVVPVAVHLALAWLLTGPLPWSVAGAGLARLGAALAVAAAALAVARGHLGGLVGAVRRPDRALFRAMLTEGSVLGLQQTVAGLMVLLLYLRVARADDVSSAAQTLTHSGVYPLLFALAWGGSQAAAAAAAQAVARGDSAGVACVTRRCLGLSAVLAVLLPWGVFAGCGGTVLALLVQYSPAGGAVLDASVSLMGWLALFFVFDFAVNFLSALLKAVQERIYLLKATVAVAVGFGLLLLVLPPGTDCAGLMGAFIAAQAAWAVLLLLRVVSCWPGATAPAQCDTPTVEPVHPPRAFPSASGVASQTLMVRSSPAEARRCPSRLKATARTASVWPRRVSSSLPAASHTRTTPSSPADANRPPGP